MDDRSYYQPLIEDNADDIARKTDLTKAKEEFMDVATSFYGKHIEEDLFEGMNIHEDEVKPIKGTSLVTKRKKKFDELVKLEVSSLKMMLGDSNKSEKELRDHAETRLKAFCDVMGKKSAYQGKKWERAVDAVTKAAVTVATNIRNAFSKGWNIIKNAWKAPREEKIKLIKAGLNVVGKAIASGAKNIANAVIVGYEQSRDKILALPEKVRQQVADAGLGLVGGALRPEEKKQIRGVTDKAKTFSKYDKEAAKLDRKKKTAKRKRKWGI